MHTSHSLNVLLELAGKSVKVRRYVIDYGYLPYFSRDLRAVGLTTA